MRGVEVVTGANQRGKSALIPIIDYCLGSEKCAVPVGEIRKAVEWFGVVLRFAKGEMLLCRRNPGNQISTDEMRIKEGNRLDVSSLPETAINRLEVIELLNARAGLPSISVAGQEKDRPSIRDMSAFEFQPQHIVANPYTLFFKADTFEHQQKLKQIFPFVLGAEDAQTFLNRRLLRDLQEQLEGERIKFECLQNAARMWIPSVQAAYSRARELGLLPDVSNPERNWSLDTYVAALVPLPDRIDREPPPPIPRGSSARVAREHAALQQEEQKLDQQLDRLKKKLIRVEKFSNTASEYRAALRVQKSRLEPLSWFSSQITANAECPFCGSGKNTAKGHLERLAEASREIEASSANLEATPVILDREVLQLANESREIEERLNEVRKLLERLDEQDEELRNQRQTRKAIDRFSGELRTQIETIRSAQDSGAVAMKVKELEDKIVLLKRDIDPQGIREREEAALNNISHVISHYASSLRIEHADRRPYLDKVNLTLTFEGEGGRRDHLWEIGSGANWMGYHLATLLALHEHFLSLPDSPVPQFIVIDQPSQAFFPEGYPDRRNAPNSKQGRWRSEDIERVKGIFRALSSAITRMRDRVQIIVIEHADEDTWKGLHHVHRIVQWRKPGEALIPSGWID